MRKDNKEFRLRFLRWKNGELVYENGRALPAYEEGTAPYINRLVDLVVDSTGMYNTARYNTNEDLYEANKRYNVTVTGKRKEPYRWATARTPQLTIGDTMKGIDAATGPLLHWMQPSQYVGAVRDAVNGRNPLVSMLRGNSGVASEEYAAEHPVLSTVLNGVIDAGTVKTFTNIPKAISVVDRRFSPNKNILTQSENTLTRYIGTGDSGYKDALLSDVIRGNITPPQMSAKNLSHIRRKFGDKISETDFRDLASGNIRSEELFNRINDILKGGSKSPKLNGRFSFSKDYSLGDSWNDYLLNRKNLADQTMLSAYMSYLSKSPEINDWIINWSKSIDPKQPRAHPLPTFALSGEKLSNGLSFPGDFAVLISNANKYARSATTFGHFRQHPTTYRPMSPFEPDITMYRRQDGLLTGHKYMVKIPKSKMKSDMLLYLSNPNYEVSPTITSGMGLDYDKLKNMNFLYLDNLLYPILLNDVTNIQKKITE